MFVSKMLKSTKFQKYFKNLRQLNLSKCNNQKYYSSNTSNESVLSYDFPPLTKGLHTVKTPKYSIIDSKLYETYVTKLNNGLRIASEKLYGEFCTVGVIIHAGPRYEKPYLNGVTHFMEKLAFSACSSYQNRDDILSMLEKHGAISDCQSGRDVMIYALSCRREGLPNILNLLAETIYRPMLTEEELSNVRQSIQFEVEELSARLDLEPVLNELIHKAAYGDSTLGNPKYCPNENVSKIDTKTLYSYMRSHYKPDRTVLTCVGIEHNEFLKLAKEKFENIQPIWIENPSLCKPESKDVIDQSKGNWIGGSCIVEKDLINHYQDQLPDLAHLVIGFESPSFNEERDFVASCVLNMIMGGGGSFSAGGPGKGMYSRLYLNVLNRYHYMFNATAYNQSYEDSGMFCIHSSAPPSHLLKMCDVISAEFIKMGESISKDELTRAKRQLQSMLFMNLEQRPVQFEDVARQVLFRGKRENPKYYFDRIELIQEEDIKRIANKILSKKPAVAALGNIHPYDPYERVQKILGTK